MGIDLPQKEQKPLTADDEEVIESDIARPTNRPIANNLEGAVKEKSTSEEPMRCSLDAMDKENTNRIAIANLRSTETVLDCDCA